MSDHEQEPKPDHDETPPYWLTGDTASQEYADLLQHVFGILANGAQPADGESFSVTSSLNYFPQSSFWQWYNPYLGPTGLPGALPGLPTGEYTLRFDMGTGTAANTSNITFRISQESLDALGAGSVGGVGEPSPDEAARLAQLADDILRSLDHLNPPQMQEMLAPAGQKSAPTASNASKIAQNSVEKAVRWKKSERNRLKFYRWLTERGDFDADVRPTHTFPMTDVLRDVAETDAYVPPVPRLSDDGE